MAALGRCPSCKEILSKVEGQDKNGAPMEVWVCLSCRPKSEHITKKMDRWGMEELKK